MPPSFRLLHSLPPELLQEILSYLPNPSLGTLNQTSKWSYNLTTPLIWREVLLTDRSTTHPGFAGSPRSPPVDAEQEDCHDDTPLLRKLVILATRPWIAAQVQVLEHRCHLPPVGIFNELPRTPLSGQTMSFDPRTVELVKLAVAGMTRCHTLRIVFGHANLNDALLRCFFDKRRVRETPVRRLWMEDCRIAAGCDGSIPSHPYGLPLELDFTGLESVRFRRMPLRPAADKGEAAARYHFVHARGMEMGQLQDGQGGMYRTTVSDVDMSILNNFPLLMRWDDEIFEELARECSLPDGLLELARGEDEIGRAETAWRGALLDPGEEDVETLPLDIRLQQRERLPSATVALNLLHSTSSTLTSLCFDWVLAIPTNLSISLGQKKSTKYVSWLSTYADLFSLRFPHLRAFQYRNAVTLDTMLPHGLFLLDHAVHNIPRADLNIEVPEPLRQRADLACLEFMEAHPNLQCLAWPMGVFFPASPRSRARSVDIANRVQAVIDNLGRTLVDLRIDAMYSGTGERQSESTGCQEPHEREQRRRFIAEFASQMTKVESIKIEGGIPRDERREVLRALHRCPLKKIVLIGVCCPIGNTWGARGVDLLPFASGGVDGGQTLDVDELSTLEGEHEDAIHRLAYSALTPPDRATFTFQPSYGWPAAPPLLHTIASFHAETVTELKFCGYKGAPVLFEPTPITAPMLASLKHFHALRSLIMSFYLRTDFEGEARDGEIISYWLDSRSPTTTALARISTDEEDMGGWERELHTRYAPRALAGQVVKQVAPFLSEKAKSRRGGVGVRASMCLGEWGGIFDLEVRIGRVGDGKGKGDVFLGFEGPREELEVGRRKGKVEGRRWF